MSIQICNTILFYTLISGGRKVFREFLRSEYSEENMLFWLACEELKNEDNAEVVEEKARLIYEDYISILSPKEVGRLIYEDYISILSPKEVGRLIYEDYIWILSPKEVGRLIYEDYISILSPKEVGVIHL